MSGAWAVRTGQQAQLGLLAEPLPCDLHGLGLPTSGRWVPRVGVWRLSIPGKSGRGSLALSDLILAVVHCHFHCILLVIRNL